MLKLIGGSTINMAQIGVSDLAVRPAEGFYDFDVRLPRPLPMRTFLPMGYEPNYPYPRVVFLHGHGSTEERALRLAPRLSRRNFISIALRGSELADPKSDGSPTYSWSNDGQSDHMVEDYVFRAIEQTRKQFHVHSERIYLAGICEGASQAYRLALSHGSCFGGLIALNGSMPRFNRPLLRPQSLRHLRVFIGHGLANSVVPLSMAREDHRLLYSAGLNVSMQTYACNHKLHQDMLNDVNRWIIENIQREDA